MCFEGLLLIMTSKDGKYLKTAVKNLFLPCRRNAWEACEAENEKERQHLF